MATVSRGLIVDRAASSGGAIAAGEVGIGFYTVTSISDTNTGAFGNSYAVSASPVIRVVGPGQTMPATFTSNWQAIASGGAPTYAEGTHTYTFQSGVVLKNF